MTDSDIPVRVVADADVLAADLLVGGDARAALDLVRSHDWIQLVASEALLDDAQAVIETLSEGTLAATWREHMEELADVISQPEAAEAGFVTAVTGDAPHLLSFDERLTTAGTNVSLQGRADLIIRRPAAFVAVFDPETVYEALAGEPYPGPDSDPRD